MSRSGFLVLAAQCAPAIFRLRNGTWLAIAIGMIAIVVLLAWGVVSAGGWLWGQTRTLTEAAPDAARSVIAQVENTVPGAREKLGELVPALKPEPPPRDVSGTDIGPVVRYPGLARSYWHREGREITVRYEGPAEFAAVLDHYAKAFVAQGYSQNVLSAAPDQEKHEYLKGGDRVEFMLTQSRKDKVKVTLVAVLPAPTSGKTQP
jgi:hypothetical protein